jgi:hypothetical protein
MATQGRGWHGDPEGHADAARERDKTNWWPLLLVPLALFIGWGARDMTDTDHNNNQTQTGVGGGAYTPCVSPQVSPGTNTR